MPHPKFNTVAIETDSRCDNHCPFCPVAYSPRPHQFLAEITVVDILQQLRDMRYRGRIHWHLYNEPLLDPRLAAFIRSAVKLVPRCYQMLNTNGNRLTSQRFAELRDAGLNHLVINRYKMSPDFSEYARASAYQGTWLGGKTYHERSRVRTFAVSVIDKRYYLSRAATTLVDRKHRLTNRAGNISTYIPAVTQPLRKKCVRPFRQLEINAAGNIVLCCNDYNGEVVFGNITQVRLQQAWTSKLANHYRKHLARGDRAALTLCQKCDYDGGAFQMGLRFVK